MSVIIDLNNKQILHVKNSIFWTLHDTITNLIEEDNLIISPNLQNFLKETDQNIYGGGAVTADIADYLKDKKDVLMLAELTKKTIQKEYDDFNRFIDAINLLQEFYNKLLEYADQLPDK